MKDIGWKAFVIITAIPILVWCAIVGAATEVRLGWLELCDDWSRPERLRARGGKEG